MSASNLHPYFNASSNPRILYVEDNPTEFWLFQAFVKKEQPNWMVDMVTSVAEARAKLAAGSYDLVISDYYLGDGTAHDLYDVRREVPMILITGQSDEGLAIEALKAGVFDYLVKQPELGHLRALPITATRALDYSALLGRLRLQAEAMQIMADSVYFTDTQLRLLFVNEAFCSMYGCTVEEALGRTLGETIGLSPDEMPAGGIAPVETQHRRKDGSLFYISLADSPIRADTGETIAHVGVIRDITQMVEARKQLEQYSLHLEAMVAERTRRIKEMEHLAAIGETAAMVGHDLRNPLQVLVNNLYMGRLYLKNADFNGLENLFKTLDGQILYMNKIVSDLQDYAKTYQPNLDEVNIGFMFNQLRTHITAPNWVNIETDVPADMPAVHIDESLVKRVVTNMINNAIQAFDDKAGKIVLGARVEGDRLVMTITDDGPGIPASFREKLFTPLKTTKARGMGLGLAVSKRIIEAHEGIVSVDHLNPRGTRFTINLPR